MIKQLWGGLPRTINNPIVTRELVVQLRKPSSFLKLFVFLSALAVILTLIWNDMTTSTRFQTYVEQGRYIFFLISALMGIFASLLVPISSAVQINLERERDTWDLLTATPLNMSSIFWGKFLSTILFLLLLFSAAIPIYGLSITLGGVAPEEVFFIMAAIVECTAIVAILGIVCSIRYKKPMTSVASTYVMAFGYFFLLPYLGVAKYLVFDFLGWKQIPFLSGAPFFLSPVAVSALYFNPNSPPPGNFVSPWCMAHPLLAHGIVLSFVLSVLVAWALWGLHRLRRRDERRLISILRRVVRKSERSRRSFTPYENGSFFSDRRNPIAEKDLHEACGSNRLRFLGTSAILFVAGCLLLGLHSKGGSPQWYFSIAWRDYMPFVVMWIFPFFLLSNAAGSIRSESDIGAWDVLRTTTLSSWKIVGGKVRACYTLFLWRLSAFYGLAFIIGVVTTGRVYFSSSGAAVARSYESFEFIIVTLVLVLAAAFFYTTLGVYVSCRAKTTTRAYLGAFVAVVLFFSAFVIIAPFFGRLGVNFWDDCGRFVSPLILCLHSLPTIHANNYKFCNLTWGQVLFIQVLWEIVLSFVLMRLSAKEIERIRG